MFDNRVTRHSPGISNIAESGFFSDMYVPDRMGRVHEYPQDFDQYVAADWLQTLNGGTAALTAGDGGLLLLTSVVSNFATVQKTPVNYQMARNFRTWFAARLAVDALVGLVIAGVMNTTATPFTGGSQTDGIIFLSDNAGALSVKVAVGGVSVTQAVGASLVAGQQAFLSWYYDGGVYPSSPNGRIVYEVLPTAAGVLVRGSIAVPAAGTIAAFPGAVNLAPIVGVSASTAVVRTLTVDSVYVAKDRVNPNTVT